MTCFSIWKNLNNKVRTMSINSTHVLYSSLNLHFNNILWIEDFNCNNNYYNYYCYYYYLRLLCRYSVNQRCLFCFIFLGWERVSLHGEGGGEHSPSIKKCMWRRRPPINFKSPCPFQYDTTENWPILEISLIHNNEIINLNSMPIIYSYYAFHCVISLQ